MGTKESGWFGVNLRTIYKEDGLGASLSIGR